MEVEWSAWVVEEVVESLELAVLQVHHTLAPEEAEEGAAALERVSESVSVSVAAIVVEELVVAPVALDEVVNMAFE